MITQIHELLDHFKKLDQKEAFLAVQKDFINTLTFADLRDKVIKLAHGMIKQGLNKADKVIIQGENSHSWVIAALGVMAAGGIPVPVDSQQTSENVVYIIDNCASHFAFLTKKKEEYLLENHPNASITIFHLDTSKEDPKSWENLLIDSDQMLPPADPFDVAVQFYTSGTTGKPKGVPLTYNNLFFEVTGIIHLEVQDETDRLLNPLPFSHVYPFVICLLVAPIVGVPIILPYSLTGPELMRALKEGNATILGGVPRILRALYEGIIRKANDSGAIGSTLFNILFSFNKWLIKYFKVNLGKFFLASLHNKTSRSLRLLLSGGAALPPDIALGLEGLGWEIATGYGLTETSPLLTFNAYPHSKLDSGGYPLKGVELKIDSHAYAGAQNGPYEIGEILTKGPQVFGGYYKLPEKTKEVFTEDGWFRTGDLGYFDKDGFLYLLGRVNTMIVTEEGKNIDPEYIEEQFNNDEYISESAILNRNGKLVAIFVPNLATIKSKSNGDIPGTIKQSVTKICEQLATYQRPVDYAISREPIPRTRMGKIMRHKLVEALNAAQSADIDKDSLKGTPIKIEDMTESDRDLLDNPTARKTWSLLAEQYANKRITPDTNMQFDLGIDSIGWLSLTLEIRQKVGIEVKEETIAKISTIRDLLKEVSTMDIVKDDKTAFNPLEEPEKILTEEQKYWLKPLGPVKSFLAKGMYAMNKLIVRSRLTVTVIGLENVPKNTQVVLAPNHISLLDSPIIASCLDYSFMKNVFWAGWVGVTHKNAFNRFISRLAGIVPIDHERAIISNMAFGAAAVKKGKTLIWFPEGMVSPDGKPLIFKPGLGVLAEKFHIPIVPVRIIGSNLAMPKGSHWPKHANIKVIFGKPVDPITLSKEGEGESLPEKIIDGVKKRLFQLE